MTKSQAENHEDDNNANQEYKDPDQSENGVALVETRRIVFVLAVHDQRNQSENEKQSRENSRPDSPIDDSEETEHDVPNCNEFEETFFGEVVVAAAHWADWSVTNVTRRHKMIVHGLRRVHCFYKTNQVSFK